eukprot:361077-Chlamydomonas_euryale.AAC.5
MRNIVQAHPPGLLCARGNARACMPVQVAVLCLDNNNAYSRTAWIPAAIFALTWPTVYRPATWGQKAVDAFITMMLMLIIMMLNMMLTISAGAGKGGYCDCTQVL